MKVHLQVDGSPEDAVASAREIAATGADGAFSFEGQHDVFFPLLLAAAAETGLELMTNVAIADHAARYISRTPPTTCKP